MDSEKIQSLFHQVCHLEVAKRQEFLDALQPVERDEVLSLLEADRLASELIDDESPLARVRDLEAILPIAISQMEHDHSPKHIGPYRILGILASGGMGIVYRAEQECPRRQVALKVVRPDVCSPSAMRRFEFEVSALGRLEHPGIARIYDAATAHVSGEIQPYFAMEFVSGSSLLKYIERLSLSIRERLELFLRIADAVHHAHQRGIIHRDLKPSNIIVDRSGQPKILDFGIAKSIDSDCQPVTNRTDAGQLLGTVAYMSPEQASGFPAEIDTRSDVYALGIILYECLTGEMPYELEGSSLLESIRRICEDSPTPLSKVNRDLRGDLETIVLKAIEKEKPRRYASVSDFANDIERFLRDEPIHARPATAGYTVKSFAKRHRGFTAGACVGILALIVALIYSLIDEKRAIAEADLIRSALGPALIKDLSDEAAENLWPRRSHIVEKMDRWLIQARALVDKLPTYQKHQKILEEAPPGTLPKDWQFLAGTDHDEALWRKSLPKLISDVETLASPSGLIEKVEQRRRVSSMIERKTIEDNASEWKLIIDRIGQSELYGGLEFSPQMGLFPLGEDPESHLFEFWVWESGDRPERDPGDPKKWRITDTTGIILVLIPGGSFTMGAHSSKLPVSPPTGVDPGSSSVPQSLAGVHDEQAARVKEPPENDGDESPVHPISLDPFFIGKYEVTQRQYSAIMETNPSFFQRRTHSQVGANHPVENLDWNACDKACRRLGLMLPTEAQWEFACRAGSDSKWFFGNKVNVISKYANIADMTRHASNEKGDFEDGVDDGVVNHAPVGSFEPNGFGLYDMIGNVWEWCRDWYDYYDRGSFRGGDGYHIGAQDWYKLGRGGSFAHTAFFGRSTYRSEDTADYRNEFLGFRVARHVETR